MRKACPDLHIGAGTITGAAQFDAACAAGSDFLVSPGTGPTLFELFKQATMPVFPGIATPSEALTAYEQGYKIQKFFPASANGGTAMLKAMAAPLADISFMPTGGICQCGRMTRIPIRLNYWPIVYLMNWRQDD